MPSKKWKQIFNYGVWRGMIWILVVVITFGLGVGAGTWLQKGKTKPSTEQEKLMEIKEYIDEYFYFETEHESEVEGLYRGLVASLQDPYSQYFSEDEYALFQREMDLNLVGIGAYLRKELDTGEVIINVY